MRHFLALNTIWAVSTAYVTPVPTTTHDGLDFVRQASFKYSDPVKLRISLVVTSKICLGLLAGLLGYRIRQFNQHLLKNMTLTHVYIFIDYISAMTFITAAAIVHNGLGITTDKICRAAIRLCLLFYTAGKVSMYLFLVERIHVLRAPYRSRWSDYLWIFSTIGICVSLGAIGVAGFAVPITSLSKADGRCRIGLQPYAIIPLLVCDIVINVLLTLVFIYLLSPVVRGNRPSGAGFASRLARVIGTLCGRAKQRTAVNLHPANQLLVRRVEKLLFKTLVGCLLVVLPASANLTALCIYRGKMPAFMCFTICIFDVTWAAVVLHWLTMASADRRESGAAL
ncbi:hypothetical protein COCMIDRAFT_99031 [Bipolaris oryzae ATCC 44560]|uniref:G-protein coupled receptors family 1 profile domain-containing protein n=1 Tax=Bipolaris oryzae ATCC 44560 TaxID=930090 RepID=W6Z328_COCMI|nr:uncharacterized protein COCMIDRAFT_99031 [Bipolaris oryzae ATCC 44560]EUC44123.1 hypothetical protein COCMIDRAFT_99031 [Bipolaris oryzae ATCC 44560]